MNTQIKKNFRGDWEARTRVMITDTMVLDIVTSKRYSKDLVTTATVSHLEGDFMSHAVYQDFSKALKSTRPSRVTAKVVEAQHALVEVDAVVEMVNEFYSLA